MDLIFTLPIVYIHVTIIICTICAVIFADIHGLLWILEKKDTLSKKHIQCVHRFIMIGLLGIVATGAVLFLTYQDYLLALTVFKIKMIFVMLLIVDAYVIGTLIPIAYERSYKTLRASEKIPLFFVAVLSTLSWIGALVAAQFLGL